MDASPTLAGDRPALPVRQDETHPGGDAWIDLLNPSPDEEAQAHRACQHRIPTRDELSEVESSSRHYEEDGAIYLSAPLIVPGTDGHASMSPLGFIVTPETLVTIRFDELKAFKAARDRARTDPPKSGYQAFTRVVEAIIDTEADILEKLGDELEDINRTVFLDTRGKRRPTDEMRAILRRLGHVAEKLGKLRHSLATLARISAYVVDNGEALEDGFKRRLNAVRDDVDSLAHFQEALTNKGQFLLDAALGFINIDQNDVIKVLTVVSVVGVPPTLVASIYGMNFKAMPELNWTYGYPYALGLIVLSTLLPLVWFKAKRWF